MEGKTIILAFSGFLLGGIGGAIGGYYFAKNKFFNMAEKEIESVKKVYAKHFDKPNDSLVLDSDTKGQLVKSAPVTAPLIDPTVKEQYKNYAGMYDENAIEGSGVPSKRSIAAPKTGKKEPKKNRYPYVITPDEFNESEYEAETLIWYSDKILADSDGNVIHNINEVVGPEALSTFGRYLDDTVYVRDDEKKIDYEIIWDVRKFQAVNKSAGDETISDED